jgi:SNF2 family DNA or RNA helicase
MPAQPVDPIEKVRPTYEKLLEIRKSKTVALKPNPMLREEVTGFDGNLQPFRLRYYQCQGVFHLLVMPRMVLGDSTGLGKTVEVIAALCYLWEKEPLMKVLVVAPKSALRQWASEIHRFTTGIRPILAAGSFEKRKKAYEDFVESPEKVVLISNYHTLTRDWRQGAFQPLRSDGRPDPKAPVQAGYLDQLTTAIGGKLTVIFDEATAFKSTRTKTWEVCREISDRSNRVYGLTATLLKNRLDEGFAIYKVVRPDVFTTKTAFLDVYCVTRMQPVGGGRKVPIVVGYKNLDLFRSRIDPFFLGRQKQEVSDELPALTTREISFELNSEENDKYYEAVSGILEMGDGDIKDYEEHKAFVSLIHCQQVVDSLSLLKFENKEPWSKEQALVDLLNEDLDGERVIVYTRFETLVGRLQGLLKAQNIKSVRITGTDSDKVRKSAQDIFQKLDSDTRVIFITDAGSEAINLQAASALIFYDSPWSWGNMIQIIGRMIRIGSPHKGVLVYHLLAEKKPKSKDDDTSTIDHHVLSLLRRKKSVIDRVIGEAAVGALEFEKDDRNTTRSLVKSLASKKPKSV